VWRGRTSVNLQFGDAPSSTGEFTQSTLLVQSFDKWTVAPRRRQRAAGVIGLVAGDRSRRRRTPDFKGYEAIDCLLLDDGGLLAWLIDRAR
jgi:hypothetical protein